MQSQEPDDEPMSEAKMSAYYDDLFDVRDPTRSAGWRHPLEQALRFEFALAGMDPWDDQSRSLLDVGCGPGALRRYMVQTQRCAKYIGVDRYGPSVQLAKQLDPEGDYIEADVLDRARHSQQFDAVLAIGAAVDGLCYRSDHERRKRLLALTRAICGLSRGYACLVILRHEELSRHPSLSHEDALIGATREELDALMRHLSATRPLKWQIVDGPTALDRGLFICRADQEMPCLSSSLSEPWALHEAVLAGPWAQDVEPWRVAWFWWISGHSQRAKAILDADPRLSEDARAASLRERLQLGFT